MDCDDEGRVIACGCGIEPVRYSKEKLRQRIENNYRLVGAGHDSLSDGDQPVLLAKNAKAGDCVGAGV